MAPTPPFMITSFQFHICDVCRLLDHNVERKWCGHCGLCDAWICEQDMNRWGRRLLAAAKRKLEPGYQGVPNYEELNPGGDNESQSNTGTTA